MITVTRKLISEEEAVERLARLADRYDIPSHCYDDSAADQMSDFDAQKWLSLCDQLRAAKQRRQQLHADTRIPSALRSIYGGMKSPFGYETPESTSDTLIDLAA